MMGAALAAPGYRLVNPVRTYAWGSATAIPELLGVAPTGEPQAELWMGAHPSAPSTVDGGSTLLERIEADPVGELGEQSAAEFGVRLPFLFKVLAAAAPLSLQAHPSAEQAREGYADENARHVPIDAPSRNYRDASHKPELVCALTPFRALGGFRAVPDTLRLLSALDLPALAGYVDALRARPNAAGLREVVTGVLTAPGETRAALVDGVVEACQAGPGEFAAECALAAELAEAYPGDAGVIIALLLNLVELQPGEALYMPAGNLHAYLSGLAVEIMANSDNILRGGLTPKHIDVPELLRVLDFAHGPAPLVLPRRGNGEEVYDVPVREFRLSRLVVGGPPRRLSGGRPQIVLCVSGAVELSTVDGGRLELPRGASAYIPANRPEVELLGDGVVFRATTNT